MCNLFILSTYIHLFQYVSRNYVQIPVIKPTQWPSDWVVCDEG